MALPDKIDLDSLLQRGQVQLLQAGDLGLGEALVAEVGERRTAPERERLLQVPLFDQSLEALQVELARLDAQQVARSLGQQPLLTEHLPQLRDVDLQGLLGRVRGLLLPE